MSIEAQIAFKNLNGKSQTDVSRNVVTEELGISFNITSDNIWLDRIFTNPVTTVTQGSAIGITASLVAIPGTNGYAYRANWPTTLPNTIDIKSGLPFQYGQGSLVGISQGTPVLGAISDSYGPLYGARPFATGNVAIPTLDSRNWFYQYNSGVFYQQVSSDPNVSSPPSSVPVSLFLYVYIGNKLSNTNSQENIRLSALGTNSYFAATSVPTISTYSTNYLYLVDFANSNTSGTVSLNISNIGTVSILKSTSTGPTALSPGDIVGSTSSSQIYYLAYDGSNFQLYLSNPVSSASSYTNPLFTNTTVGGIETGSNFNNAPLQDVFNGLLYPGTLGNGIITGFTLNSGNSILELGQGLTPSTYQFSWSSQNLTGIYTIEDVSSGLTSSTWPASGLLGTSSTNTFDWNISATISSTFSRTRDIIVRIRRENGIEVSKTLSINWLPRLYYGSSTFSSLTHSGILNLQSGLFSSASGVWGITGSGFKYFAAPSNFSINSITSFGLPVALSGNTFSNDIDFTPIIITNSFGVGNEYKIYRTKNQINGTFSININ